jgi:fumarylacetoacetase
MLDGTHDPALQSWVETANGHRCFPIQNLPVGIVSPPDGTPRGGVAIGDQVLDLAAALAAGLFDGPARQAAEIASPAKLNNFLAADVGLRRALRQRLSEILSDPACQPLAPTILWPMDACVPHLPVQIGNFSDFFAGIHHATTAGMINRPDNPLMPNYKYVPVAYHSRSSSVRVSGAAVRRPNGQRKPPGQSAPDFGASRGFDYELELGVWIGQGNELGTPIPIAEAGRHVAGLCLLNDWSARDIQAWESAPLGPFLSKSLSTTVSPWIVTAEALAPFRRPQPPRPAGDPAPLPHLLDPADQASGCFNIVFEVLLLTRSMREAGSPPHRLSVANASMLYWTVAQMIAHPTSNGCNLLPGDLLGSGTISGTEPGSEGCLLEMTRGGQKPVTLPNGETRTFLQDGDEIIFTAACHAPNRVSIGFGECRGVVTPALAV